MILVRKPVPIPDQVRDRPFRGSCPQKNEQGQSPAPMSSISEPLARLSFLLSSRRQRVSRRGLSLPRLGPLGSAGFLCVSALRGGTLTDVESVVITEHNATFVRGRELRRAPQDAYTRHEQERGLGHRGRAFDTAQSMTPE